MEKIGLTSERNDSLIVTTTGHTILFYGYGEEEGQGYCWRQDFQRKPTKEELTDVIIKFENELTDEKILKGYVWNGKNVWLSTENQFNFKAAYDVAVQLGGASLPITFKLGEEENGRPIYFTFEDMVTFADFYTHAIAFIQETLAEGWLRKDAALDWIDSVYTEN